jgi:predicted small secreted protein
MHSHRATAVVALTTTVLLAGCNTMQGLGEDMRQGGIALSDAATRAQDNSSSSPPADAQAPRISMDRARTLALAARAGELTGGELARGPGGALRYAFTVHTDDGAYAVGIDAQTGAVLENRRLTGE